MALLYRQARSHSPTFLDSPEGLALWREMEADALQEAVSTAGFSFPVLVIQSAAMGFMSAGVCTEAGGECEPITETTSPPGLFFPVRALYVELASLRIVRRVFTEELWRKMQRQLRCGSADRREMAR